MDILFVCHEYPPLGGGAGVAVATLARTMAEEHHVEVLTSGHRGLPKVEDDGKAKILRVRVPSRQGTATPTMPALLAFSPMGRREARTRLDGRRYDVVNTWFAIPGGWLGTVLARRFSARHVITLPGADVYDPSRFHSPHASWLFRSLIKRVITRADLLVTLSKDMLERLQSTFHPQVPSEVVHLGIDVPKGPSLSRRSLGLSEERRYLISVARLVKRKNQHALLRALALQKDPCLELIFIGEGPMKESLAALARQLGISNRVHFRGLVSDEEKFQLMKACDAFILCSHHEAFGLVYLEALHCGIPVIAGTVGGQTDFLSNGETGVLCDPCNIEEIAAAMQHILSLHKDNAARERYRTIAGRYSTESMARRYAQLFARLTGRAT